MKKGAFYRVLGATYKRTAKRLLNPNAVENADKISLHRVMVISFQSYGHFCIYLKKNTQREVHISLDLCNTQKLSKTVKISNNHFTYTHFWF